MSDIYMVTYTVHNGNSSNRKQKFGIETSVVDYYLLFAQAKQQHSIQFFVSFVSKKVNKGRKYYRNLIEWFFNELQTLKPFGFFSSIFKHLSSVFGWKLIFFCKKTCLRMFYLCLCRSNESLNSRVSACENNLITRCCSNYFQLPTSNFVLFERNYSNEPNCLNKYCFTRFSLELLASTTLKHPAKLIYRKNTQQFSLYKICLFVPCHLYTHTHKHTNPFTAHTLIKLCKRYKQPNLCFTSKFLFSIKVNYIPHSLLW